MAAERGADNVADEQGENRAESDVDKVIQRRFFPAQGQGVFVDVGAAKPNYLSVSALYRSLGWTILAIEPNPAFAKLYRQRGHEVLEYACGSRDEDDVPFCVVNSHEVEYKNGRVSFESWSSLAIKDEYAALKPDFDVTHIRVKLRRLDSILAEHARHLDHIDILSVDVEGWELEVLSGLTFSRYKPRVMVIENLFFDSRYHDFMAERGYVLWKCLPPNDIYARKEEIGVAEGAASFLQASLVTGVGRMRKTVSRLLRSSSKQ
jgi:FkbM family methyltransferase